MLNHRQPTKNSLPALGLSTALSCKSKSYRAFTMVYQLDKFSEITYMTPDKYRNCYLEYEVHMCKVSKRPNINAYMSTANSGRVTNHMPFCKNKYPLFVTNVPMYMFPETQQTSSMYSICF